MGSIAKKYVELLRGTAEDSPLLTDGYKFAMAQAGFPLRTETFYLHFRQGGPLFIPFDLKEVVELLRPRLPDTREQGFLVSHGYGLTPAMEEALKGDLDIWAMPQNSWVNEQEPVLTVTGPSFLVSWLEPLLVALHFPLQVATAIKDGQRAFRANCWDEEEIIKLVGAVLNERITVTADAMNFVGNIQEHITAIKDALKGQTERAFEVGMRSMTCLQQHRAVLQQCRAAGMLRTSNVYLAYELYMTPVGTTGHEHQCRFGSDADAYRAVRDRRPEPPSYLPDTYNVMQEGIPAALEVMREDPDRRSSVRLDSGDQRDQLLRLVEADREVPTHVFYIFEGDYNPLRIANMEQFANGLELHHMKRHYGLGGYLVGATSVNEFTRNHCAMVYKLCQTGSRPVRKHGSGPGKTSIGGRPKVIVNWKAERFIAQQGEVREERCIDIASAPQPAVPSILSPETERVNVRCFFPEITEA